MKKGLKEPEKGAKGTSLLEKSTRQDRNRLRRGGVEGILTARTNWQERLGKRGKIKPAHSNYKQV